MLTPVLCALVAGVLALRTESTYRASALLRIETDTIDTDVELLGTSSLRDTVEDQLGDDAGGIGVVFARRVGETQLVEVFVESRSPEVAASAANAWVNAYRERRTDDVSAELRIERDSLLEQADELSPQIITIQSEMQQLREVIDAATDEDADADPESPTDASLSEARLTQLQTELTRLEALQRDFQERALTIDAELFDVSRTVSVEDEAEPPGSPASPKPLRSAAVSFFAGLLLGVVAAGVAELIDDPVYDEADAERWAGGLPVIATIPTAPAARGDKRQPLPITIRDPQHPASEAYRVLWTSLEYLAVGQSVDRIMITSPEAAEGKTITAVNLAITAARAGKGTVLVDADLRRGAVAQTLCLSPGAGLAEVLSDRASVEECMVNVPGSDSGRLRVLLSGAAPPNPAELVSSGGMMSRTISELSANYTKVIVDTPPMLAVSESLTAARFVDGVVIVVRARVTRGRALKAAVRRVEKSGVRILGLVFNDDRRKLRPSTYLYAASRGTGGTVEHPESPRI